MKTIRTQLLVSFGLLLLVPMTVFNLVFVISSLDQSRTQILRQLSSVASLKENAILSWEKLLSQSVVSIRIRERLDEPGILTTGQRLKAETLLNDLLEELFVVDAAGRVIASSSPENSGKVLRDKTFFSGLFTHGYVSPPFYDLTQATMQVVAAAPLVTAEGRTIGSLVGRANLSVLDQVMAERTGLGRTGQTYLVGSNSLLVTPSREGERNAPVSLAGVTAAVSGRGTIEKTYRTTGGTAMIATFRWIDSLKLVLVAEQEQSEAYGVSMGILATNLWTEGVFVLLALFGGLVATRSLVRPLRDLTETALAISGGDLTRLAREDGPRETALVGRAFNTMTTRLRGSIAELTAYQANLEGIVAERTTDLVIARNRAEESDRLKSTFLATMSHELRTPLNSIIGFTGILSQGLVGPLNEEQKKQLGFVMNSSRHLLELISDILDISKIEAGQFKVEALPFDLAAVVTKSAKCVEPLAQRKNLALTTEGSPLPGPLVGDARRVEQVLLNLLSNAVKFTEAGSVKIRYGAEGNKVKVEVTDTGPGISPGNLAKLFKPFQQLDTGLDRLHQGTGLGLSICKRLMELMGGTIEVRSTPGEGSTFSFELPLPPPGRQP